MKMKYVHVLDRERDPYFGSLLHMMHLVESLTCREYAVVVIDYHHMFEDSMRWQNQQVHHLDENYMYLINRDAESPAIWSLWEDLEDWIKRDGFELKSRDIFIFSFTTQTDIRELCFSEPENYPLYPNLVMAKSPKYPELYQIMQRLDSYSFSEAVIKWFPNNDRTEVLSKYKDRNILSEQMVNIFEIALRESETKNGERGKHV